MIKKAFIVLFVINSISVIQSCCTEEYKYNWIDFNIAFINNSGTDPVIDQSTIINKKAFGMRVMMLDSIYYLAGNFTIGNSCYATSCGEKYTRTHNLVSVKVKTLNNYSNNYIANGDITNLFKARRIDSPRSEYISIDEIIEYINNSNTPLMEFDLYLLDTTCAGGTQEFDIECKMSDGITLNNQTGSLLFQ